MPSPAAHPAAHPAAPPVPQPKTRKKRLVPQEEAHLLYKDPARQAELAGLHYAHDHAPGLHRKAGRTGKFSYYAADGAKISDPQILARIAGYVVPPAWTAVWIAADPLAHLQVTGLDAAGRKQYRYHPAWDATRSLTKFERLHTFGEQLEPLRRQLRQDLARPGLPREKVIALVLTLMDQSFIRVGNKEYAQANGKAKPSYGLTTLQDDHVSFSGDDVRFAFVGKKGVPHDVTLHDRKLVRLVRKCKEIPGQHLFQYYSADGQRHALESGDVNRYLHEKTGLALSAKDFRTWGGTVKMVACLEAGLREAPDLAPEKAIKRAVLDVAAGLGNTPTVCAKYYIHPQVVALFRSGELLAHLGKPDAPAKPDDLLSPIERRVLALLAR